MDMDHVAGAFEHRHHDRIEIGDRHASQGLAQPPGAVLIDDQMIG